MAGRNLLNRSLTLSFATVLASAAVFSFAGCADALTFSKTERTQGRIALQEGDYEEAAITFANQVRRNPKDYRAHFHLGEARWSAGRFPEAVRSYMTALDVMEFSPRGQSDPEFKLIIIDELAGALAEVDHDGHQLAEIERLATGNKTKKLLVALTHGKAGRPDAAIASFREARSLDRTDPQIAKSFGLYLEGIQQELAAEEMLRRAYALNPQDEEVAAALRRLGIIPGPAILSKNQLTRPTMPLGPLPQVSLSDLMGGEGGEGAPAQAEQSDTELN